MISIESKEQHPYGELWLSTRNMLFENTLNHIFGIMGIKPINYLQQMSDLNFQTFPIYACQIPAVSFFPFVTYISGTWFNRSPSFIIPHKPLNRLDGRYWLDSYAQHPMLLVEPRYSNDSFGWVEAGGKINSETLISHSEMLRLSFAAKSYFLDGIRYVYDENKSTLDHRKTNTPSRHIFDDQVASFEGTKEYLEWYLSIFNSFYKRFEEAGKRTLGITNKDYQEDCQHRLLAIEWTMTRLAVDVFTIASNDVPYIRKWQFFGFLDALGGLFNLVVNDASEKSVVLDLLTLDHFQNEIVPVLNNIPVIPLRDAVVGYTQQIYEAIAKIGDETISGPSLLWAYRNSRHGYNLRDRKNAMRLSNMMARLATTFLICA
jgi:hypothetical protein